MGSFDELINHITNVTIFTDSCEEYGKEISAPLIITTISMIFMVVAGFDYMCGNRIGLGQKYVEGWEALPSLALSMIGITALSPVIRILLQPFLAPVFKFLCADPSMFAGTLLSCDMGGYPLAIKLAGNNYAVGVFSGCILASMMGSTIVFNIPVGLTLIPEKCHIYFAYGTLLGLITVPLGCIAGGATMTVTPYHLTMIEILKNLIPVIIISAILCLLLFFFPNASMRGFLHFSSFVKVLCTLGAILAAFQEECLIRFPLLSTMIDPDENDGENPLYSAIFAIGEIAIMLTGTLPMVYCIYKYLGKYLTLVGKYVGLDELGSAGIVSCLSSSIPTFEMFKDMTPQSMIINSAFAVGGAFVLGDDLAYIGAVQNDMIVPMIVGKLTQGITAILLSALTSKYFLKRVSSESEINNLSLKESGNIYTDSKTSKNNSMMESLNIITEFDYNQ